MGPIEGSSLPELSLVVPMYNEADGCPTFFETVIPILERVTTRFEIVCVDDGSQDATLARLCAFHDGDPRIKVLALSRNFGKEAALTAGLDAASGRAVIPIDADLQDPPELIVDMVRHWREGAQVVVARRVDRHTDDVMKRLSARLFYGLSAQLSDPAIPRDVGDFRLMDRVVVDALGQLPERTRFMKGLFAWVGYRCVVLEYARPSRAVGASKFSFPRLWNFALDGITSFSAFPLKIWSYVGFTISICAVLYMLYIIIRTLIFGIDVPGYASIISLLLFLNGVILVSLGALGEYVARIFIEVKQRPIYLVSETRGFAGGDADGPARATPDEEQQEAGTVVTVDVDP